MLCLSTCLTLCSHMDCSSPGPSVHGILQARILEWVAISPSRGSSRPRDQTRISLAFCIGRGILYQQTHLKSPIRNIYRETYKGFPAGSAGKESTRNAGDLSSIPGLGRSPGEGNGNRLQYPGLENSTGCIVHGVAKSQTRLSKFHFHTETVLGKYQPTSRQNFNKHEIGYPSPMTLKGLKWAERNSLMSKMPKNVQGSEVGRENCTEGTIGEAARKDPAQVEYADSQRLEQWCFLALLHWVFVASSRLSLAVQAAATLELRCSGFSLQWLLWLWSMGSRHMVFSSFGMWGQEFQLLGARAGAQQPCCSGGVALRHVESSSSRDQARVLCTGRWSCWTTGEVPRIAVCTFWAKIAQRKLPLQPIL